MMYNITNRGRSQLNKRFNTLALVENKASQFFSIFVPFYTTVSGTECMAHSHYFPKQPEFESPITTDTLSPRLAARFFLPGS